VYLFHTESVRWSQNAGSCTDDGCQPDVINIHKNLQVRKKETLWQWRLRAGQMRARGAELCRVENEYAGNGGCRQGR